MLCCAPLQEAACVPSTMCATEAAARQYFGTLRIDGKVQIKEYILIKSSCILVLWGLTCILVLWGHKCILVLWGHTYTLVRVHVQLCTRLHSVDDSNHFHIITTQFLLKYIIYTHVHVHVHSCVHYWCLCRVPLLVPRCK